MDTKEIDNMLSELGKDMQHFSNLSKMKADPRYIKIKQEGQKVIKCCMEILRRAATNYDTSWKEPTWEAINILGEIIGYDAIKLPDDKKGQWIFIVSEWIKWGDTHGY
jgi:hypothetical protein